MVVGNGGLTKLVVTTNSSTAEFYLHGAHVTHYQKHSEPPIIFLSRKSWFTPGKPIRGGVPICFPWFGNRDGEPSHGFARLVEWQLVNTSAATDGTVTLHLSLPKSSMPSAWQTLRTEFVVTVGDALTMELIVANDARDGVVRLENCLHTYFQVGDIARVVLTGLCDAPFDDFAAGDTGSRKVEHDAALHVAKEINRVYPDNSNTVEIDDDNFGRTIRVEKFHSKSTVVWNPWTTQKLPDDFDPAEHQHMVCVESGNVKQNAISLEAGKSATLKVVVSSRSAPTAPTARVTPTSRGCDR